MDSCHSGAWIDKLNEKGPGFEGIGIGINASCHAKETCTETPKKGGTFTYAYKDICLGKLAVDARTKLSIGQALGVATGGGIGWIGGTMSRWITSSEGFNPMNSCQVPTLLIFRFALNFENEHVHIGRVEMGRGRINKG